MKVLLLSDIHSNLAALEAVVEDADAKFDIAETWVLGDLVGYGPRPAETLSLLSSIGAVAVAGNHDLAVAGVISAEAFNPVAAAAVSWTQGVLSNEHLDQLRELPARLERHGITLVHGSPRDPVWEYVMNEGVAAQALDDVYTTGLAVGHTHVPVIFRQLSGEFEWIQSASSRPHSLAGSKFLVNPGSVGQPRDHDPRASYAVLDLDAETVTHRRVEYDHELTASKIREAGLPAFLADRLRVGV
ncbi:MAG: metallophosphoesterase family protein [Chloroflexi bacterium]|nr:metallophosphoesterase family protein [Chloroflexota bacterium]